MRPNGRANLDTNRRLTVRIRSFFTSFLLLFLIVVQTLFSTHSNAQSISFASLSANQIILACDTDSIVFQVFMPFGQSFASGDAVAFELDFPSSVNVVSAQGAGLTIQLQSAQYLACTVQVQSATDTVRLVVEVRANCNSLSSAANLTHTITGNAKHLVGGNALSTATLQGRHLTMDKGVLNLRRVLNRKSRTSLFGTVQRCFVYHNTGSGPLTADLFFQDSIKLENENRWLEFKHAEAFVSPWISSFSTILEDSVVSMHVSLENLPSQDSIFICDSVQLMTCPKTDDDFIETEFSLSYGCKNEDLCQHLHDPILNIAEVGLDNSAPIIQMVEDSLSQTCPADSNYYRYRVRNVGSGAATGVTFSGYYLYIEKSLSSIDTNSISVFGLDPITGSRLPFTFSAPGPRVHIGLQSGTPVFNIYIDTVFQPGAEFYIEYREYERCPDSLTIPGILGQSSISMFAHTLLGRLEHPCRPSQERYPVASYKKNQSFSLGQYLNNLIGTMKDQQIEWFDVPNSAPLRITNSYFGSPFVPVVKPVYYDTNRFRIEVDIELDSGLCLADADSFFLFSDFNDSIIEPVRLYASGSSLTACDKNTVTAVFKLPPHFWTTNSYGRIAPSAHYDNYFKNFHVRFQLKANCAFVDFSSGGKAKYVQTVFAVYDTACTPACRIPVHQIVDEIQINCPGCHVPGWNLEAFDIVRTNLGGADSNDNNFPDAIPNAEADSNLASLHRFMLGDTLALNVQAFISDGSDNDTVGYMHEDLKFPFHYGVFYIDNNPLLRHLTPIAFNGTLQRNGKPDFTFTIDANDPAQSGFWVMQASIGRLSISLDSATFAQLGCQDYTEHRPYDRLNLNLTFRVKDNFVGEQPTIGLLYNLEAPAIIYMSGTPFNLASPKQKTDVFRYEQSVLTNPDSFSMAQLSELSYWCTAWEGRAQGVGYHPFQLISGSRGANVNICLQKDLTYQFTMSTGRSYNQFHYGLLPTLTKAFPYEIRDLQMLDSLRMEVPDNYNVRGVQLRLGTLQGTPQNTDVVYTQLPFPATEMEWTPEDVYLDFWNLTNRVVTTPFLNPGGGIDPSRYHSFFDESKRYQVQVLLEPEDCTVYPIGIDTLRTMAHYRNNPAGNDLQPGVVHYDMSRSNPRFEGSTSNFVFDGQDDIAFDLNLRIDNIARANIPNVFVWMESEQGSVEWVSINGHHVIPTSGIFTLGQGMLAGAKDYRYRMVANYDCSAVDGDDVIKVYYGYSCNGPVTSKNDPYCEIDSTEIVIINRTPGIQASEVFPSAFSACDTNWHSITISPTGDRSIENVRLSIDLPFGASIPGNAGSSSPFLKLTYQGNETRVVGNQSNQSVDFDFNGLIPRFIGTPPQDQVVLEIPYFVDCNFNPDQPFALDITATDFCGKVLQPIDRTHHVTDVTGSFDIGQLSLQSLAVEVVTDCNDSINYTVSIANSAVAASDLFQVEFYCTESASGPLSAPCLIGTSESVSISGNSTQSILTTLLPSCADCEAIYAVINPVSACYCGANSDTARTTAYCGSCSVTADFTYSILEGCRLQLIDQSSGAQPIVQQYWTVKDANNGTMLASSSQPQPVFQGLSTPSLEVCLVAQSGSDSTCTDTLCRSIDLCCVEPVDTCSLKALVSIEGENCEVMLMAGFSSSSSPTTVEYTWMIKAPGQTSHTTYPSSTTDLFNYHVNTSGLHEVCLIVSDDEGCVDTVCQQRFLTRCPTPCEIEGEVAYQFNKEECVYLLSIQPLTGSVTYQWTVSGPNGSNIVPQQGGQLYQAYFTPAQAGVYEACVEITQVFDNGDTCSKVICKRFDAKGCVDPCAFDGKIAVDFNKEKCSYEAFLEPLFSGATSVQYEWKVIESNGINPLVYPATSSSRINFSGVNSSSFKICLTLSWQIGETSCDTVICQRFDVKECEVKPCSIEGELKKRFDPESCAYYLSFSNASGAQITQYQWKVTDQNGVTATVLPSSNAAQVKFISISGSTYKVCLTLSWRHKKTICDTTICEEFKALDCEPKPCELEGAIQWKFDKETCKYSLDFENQSGVQGLQYDWEVKKQGGSTLPTAVPLAPNNAAATVSFATSAGYYYSVSLRVKWKDGEIECEKSFQMKLESQRCKQPCEVSAAFTHKMQRKKCMYEFTQTNPTGSVFQQWDIYNNSGQLIYTQSGVSIQWTPPSAGTYFIELHATGSFKGCNKKEKLKLEVKDCKVGWWQQVLSVFR